MRGRCAFSFSMRILEMISTLVMMLKATEATEEIAKERTKHSLSHRCAVYHGMPIFSAEIVLHILMSRHHCRNGVREQQNVDDAFSRRVVPSSLFSVHESSTKTLFILSFRHFLARTCHR
ncbi:hypothetical protein BDN70DRAFT_375900 [Pholiota conissans]|uniref:Secreted protein n=1 Tax=Pholiota conissans TaxID=109636 RepID=A0A9P5YTD2_9AGAR|nr:hypothetical protein BDN70DRAFT_375900 [Pholiota conissans]